MVTFIFRDYMNGRSAIIASTENDGACEWTVTGPRSVNCVLRIEPVSDPAKGTIQGLFTIGSSGASAWESMSEMPYALTSHGSVEVGGKIYIIGGYLDGAVTGTVLEYDPSDQTYTERPSMPTARNGFACAAIDGKIYVAGGA